MSFTLEEAKTLVEPLKEWIINYKIADQEELCDICDAVPPIPDLELTTPGEGVSVQIRVVEHPIFYSRLMFRVYTDLDPSDIATLGENFQEKLYLRDTEKWEWVVTANDEENEIYLLAPHMERNVDAIIMVLMSMILEAEFVCTIKKIAGELCTKLLQIGTINELHQLIEQITASRQTPES